MSTGCCLATEGLGPQTLKGSVGNPSVWNNLVTDWKGAVALFAIPV